MRFFFLIALCFTFFSLCSQSNDSITPRSLDEVVVIGDRVWIEDGVINCIPTKTEKKLSNSPATLVKSMHMPFLQEKGGMIVNMSGEIVPVFINGERADEIDLATFWPKEVKRVQYLENPSDPAYEGINVAVNFIVARRETGGVTRVNLFQRIPNSGHYSTSSKLVYKKMTYGFLFWGDYERDHNTSSTGETQYRDIFYDGNKYDLIRRTEDISSYSRETNIRCAFNAKYSTDRILVNHTVSLGWTRNPGSSSHSENVWSEDLFESQTAWDFSKSISLSPQISGKYTRKLSDKWYMAGMWVYSYARNENSSLSQMGVCDLIYNSSNEDVHTGKVVILPSFIPSERWLFQFRTTGVFDWYSTLYQGTANVRESQSRQEISSTLKIHWSASHKLDLSFEPGVSASLWQIGAINRHTVNPTASASAGWKPSRKFTLGSSLAFYMRTTTASESNPVMVKASELLWLKGNPYLKSLTSRDAYIYSTYLPKSWLSMSLGFGYVRTSNSTISTYTPAPVEAGGLIKETLNARPSDNMRANMELRASFLDNLSVAISPQWYHTYVRGAYQDNFDFITLSGRAYYTIGNFRMELWYEGPYKELSMSGMERSWIHDNWNTSLTFGSGDLYLECRVEDIFNNKKKSWIHFTSPNYTSRRNTLNTGRSFTINLTYTFGYGKRVDRHIDIDGPNSAKTSILLSK